MSDGGAWDKPNQTKPARQHPTDRPHPNPGGQLRLHEGNVGAPLRFVGWFWFAGRGFSPGVHRIAGSWSGVGEPGSYDANRRSQWPQQLRRDWSGMAWLARRIRSATAGGPAIFLAGPPGSAGGVIDTVSSPYALVIGRCSSCAVIRSSLACGCWHGVVTRVFGLSSPLLRAHPSL